jgi:surface polysaccharide O-acyltransferase-like enzyme
MLTVFLFHCGRFFDQWGWHVKNPQTTLGFTLANIVLLQWLMPLFFVLSGMSAYYSLEHQDWRQFIVSRLKRLVVPLVFGIFVVIAPLEVYLERLTHGRFSGSFWQFYPHYFEGWYGFGGNFAWVGIHLWYLEILFCYSMLALPVFLYLKTPRAAAQIGKAAGLLCRPGAIFLLCLPIVALEYIANLPAVRQTALGIRGFGGWSILPYFPLLVLGYLVAADGRLGTAIERHRIVALVLVVITHIVGHLMYYTANWPQSGPTYSFLRGLNCWAWLIVMFGFAGRYLTFKNQFLKYANEAVLPFYILHQTVILSIGFYAVQLNVSIAAKYVIICATSFLAIMAIYDLAVKRIDALRFLFGMKPAIQPGVMVS